jgi:hypothetical protein
VGRFDRQDTEARDLPAVLGTAAEEFRTSIEREVRTVLEAAQTRAAALERQAEFNASQREQLSEHRAKQIVDSVFNRAARVLDSIDLIENALSGMLDALRAELQSLAPHAPDDAIDAAAPRDADVGEARAALEQDTPAQPEPETSSSSAGEAPRPAEPAVEAWSPPISEPVAESEPVVESEPVAAPEAPPIPAPEAPPVEPQPAADAIAVDDQAPAEGPPAKAESEWQEHEGWPGPAPINPEAHVGLGGEDGSSEFEQMVRRQLKKMRASGKSRAEAEHFLERFHFAGDYFGALEEIYGDNGVVPPPRRKGLFGLLRRRSD